MPYDYSQQPSWHKRYNEAAGGIEAIRAKVQADIELAARCPACGATLLIRPAEKPDATD